jgi:polysaccharide export outer membrane protein
MKLTATALLAFTLTLAAGSAIAAAAQPPAAQTQKPADQKPDQKPAAPAQTPYKPDFAIPRPDDTTTAPPPPVGTPAGANYIIGAQDQISITVVDESDLTGKYRVDGDGQFTFPFLGRVTAAGLTLTELQQKLTQALQNGYIKDPQVRVEMDIYKSQSVYVIGKVRTPGKMQMTGTQMTLLEALAMAGSPTADASNEVIVVHPKKPIPAGTVPSPDEKNDGEEIRVNRRDLELGRVGQDVVLRDGDIINVPEAQRFYITGWVRNPGYYVLDPGMTVEQALALAGGLSERGSTRGLSATRMINGKRTDISLKMDDKVQANDTISVKQRLF